MAPAVRHLAYLAVATLVVAAVVWTVGERQTDAVERSVRQTEDASAMLTAMLEQQASVRGFLQTGQEVFLEPFQRADARFQAALGDARRYTAQDDHVVHELLNRSETLSRRWHTAAESAIAVAQVRGTGRVPVGEALARKRIFDDFRAVTSRLTERLRAQRSASLQAASLHSFLVVVALSVVFSFVAWLVLLRPSQAQARDRTRETRRRERQGLFAQTLQAMEGEHEAHGLVKKHLERELPGTEVVVLARNNSADRLLAATEIDPDSELAFALEDAGPRSCLSVRMGTQHEESTGDDLLSCGVCFAAGECRKLCTPLVVSGEVIGSVLVTAGHALEDADREVVTDTVVQAAPVIANMRNLAVAELRAATDALTGLPNRRSLQDSMHRMFALAARTARPIALVAIDIDHFKTINDRFGHDRGDEVLAGVAATLASALRTSDLVGRLGGEEFLAILPETDLDGALTAAETLRTAVQALQFPGVDHPVTASFGIAVCPEDGRDSAAVLRLADRALYAAKAGGRNRVEAASALAEPAPLA